MDSILDRLGDSELWYSFYNDCVAKNKLSSAESEQLLAFIQNKGYIYIAKNIKSPSFKFSVPKKVLVNKKGTVRKRAVYVFNEDEVYTLKLLCRLLYKYDDKISPVCYSFRKSRTVKQAIGCLRKVKGIKNMYCVKTDIHNYFNSIPADKLFEETKRVTADDEALVLFFKKLLLENKAVYNNTVIEENRGAMAGTPISPFFANIYLTTLDEKFLAEGIPYIRYSDDIIFFAPTEKKARQYLLMLREHVSQKGLTLNEEKTVIKKPREKWEFLGFSYQNGVVDISSVAAQKLKAKIKRKARALYRWRQKKNVAFDKTAAVLIKRFNRKLYDDEREGDFSWSRWFFPVINTADTLKEIDAYFVQNIRYIYSGRYYKGNYRVSYEDIKKLGYRSLVAEYYKNKDKDKDKERHGL